MQRVEEALQEQERMSRANGKQVCLLTFFKTILINANENAKKCNHVIKFIGFLLFIVILKEIL